MPLGISDILFGTFPFLFLSADSTKKKCAYLGLHLLYLLEFYLIIYKICRFHISFNLFIFVKLVLYTMYLREL